MPLIVLLSDLRDYAVDRARGAARSFRRTFVKSIILIGVASGIGWLPSIVLGKFGCLGEYCVPTVTFILGLFLASAIFALLSAALSRRYGVLFFGICFLAIAALLLYALLKISTCNFGNDYSCLGVRAARSHNLAICDAIRAPDEQKTSCYIVANKKWGNIEACRKMGLNYYDGVRMQYYCLADVAVITKRMDACNELAVDRARGDYIAGWRSDEAIQRCKEFAQKAIDDGYESFSAMMSGER